jgi:hypothetical protein
MRKGEIDPDQDRTASRLIAPITITITARVSASASVSASIASVSASIARVSASTARVIAGICGAHQPFENGLPPPQMA